MYTGRGRVKKNNQSLQYSIRPWEYRVSYVSISASRSGTSALTISAANANGDKAVCLMTPLVADGS
jgi:hypothetical protein